MTDQNPGGIPVAEVPELEPFRPRQNARAQDDRVVSAHYYEIEIWHDPFTENPNEEVEPLLRLVSFNSRHMASEPIDDVLGCLWDSDGNQYPCGWPSSAHDPDNRRYDAQIHDHDFEGRDDVAFTLSYYEHGNCLWTVGDPVVSDPGGFDTVRVAGALIIESPDEWNDLDTSQQRHYAETFVDQYTKWVNGETYGFTATEVTEYANACPTCERTYDTEREVVEQVGAYIGYEWAKEQALAGPWGGDVKLIEPH